MNEAAIAAIAVIIAATVGALGGLVPYIWSRKRDKAEAANFLADAAVSLLKPHRDRITVLENQIKRHELLIESLKAQVERYRTENDHLIQGVRLLVSQLKGHDITPVWEPEKNE